MLRPSRRLVMALGLSGLSGCIDLVHNDTANPQALRQILAAREPAATDVALALGCPTDDDTGATSMCERCRVKSALRAFRDGEVRGVIFSGGAAHNRFIEAEAMGRLALERGLPPEALELEPDALTTWMNLRYSQRIMKRRGWATALIVTTANHVPRAKRFADHFGIRARYRACDLDQPADSDGEWSGPIRPRPFHALGASGG